MDYIEFREDGQVWGLLLWPPDEGTDLYLNVSGTYSVSGERITFTGSCRYKDPCSGAYEMTYVPDAARLVNGDSLLVLAYVDTPSLTVPPRIPGPMPTPTAASPQK